jgi:hypothetical protein
MLYRFVHYVDLTCYTGFAFFRLLIPDIGDTYRNTLDAATVTTLDAWVRSVLVVAEESMHPEAVWRRHMERFVENLAGTRTLETKRDFTLDLVREKGSPRFRAEAQKITDNPELLASRIVRSRPVPAEADATIQQALLNDVASAVPPGAWMEPDTQPALDAFVGKIEHIPDALRRMRKMIVDGFPWATTRQMWDEADQKAQGKVDWQQDKFATHEKPWGDVEQVDARLIADETEQIHARLEGQKYFAAVEKEIRQRCRAQREKRYLRLWRLYWENGGDLPQTEETARRAAVRVRTVKNFFADARKWGWIQK